MSTNYTIRITRGDTWSDLKVGWKDSAGTMVSVTSARMYIRQAVNSSTTMEELSTTGGEITIDGDGYVVPTLTAAQTAALSSGVYDLEAISAAGEVKTLISGLFRVDADVTR